MDNLDNNYQTGNVSPANARREGTTPSPCFDSTELLGIDGLAIILHQGQRYQLRQTKAGKLILTK